MPKVVDIHQFLQVPGKPYKIIDVRSPKEFEQGHIPGAVNIPLFDNDERAVIGTLYKQTGRQPAILKGMELVGPRMAGIVQSAVDLAIDNTVYVHCWRGGMRSGFVAMLLEMYGLNVFLLKGGYKKFRHLALETVNATHTLLLLSGNTGSGKTYILKKMKDLSQQVIDLEGLAHHKGSAFGALGEKPQPTQEQFENELTVQLLSVDKNKVTWLEDESRMIGKIVLPPGLWEQMRTAEVYYMNLSFDERLNHIVKEYGRFPKEELETSILKITKRLGHEESKNAIIALHEGDLHTALGICLRYYDKTYGHGLSIREKESVHPIPFEKLDVEEIAKALIEKLSVNTNGKY
ncbi:MAG: tRNA 2-selenouridine(34) synthase MnmH [Bacteroidetes bacterium]|nr:tRNA 2-selenouridine(34) synthase MnmH [Bacteroidota bacterium]